MVRDFRVVVASLALATLMWSPDADACPNCATSEQVWFQIAHHAPALVLGTITVAFVVVAAVILVAARLAPKARMLVGASLLLGSGMGALFDGIVLHQILQWHAMISSRLPPLELVASKVNMFWDGIFHLYCWTAVVVALVILVRELPKAAAPFARDVVTGCALGGWGLFNVVEGLIDHHIAQFHHVHPGINQLAWDIGFLMLGVALMAGGGALVAPHMRRD